MLSRNIQSKLSYNSLFDARGLKIVHFGTLLSNLVYALSIFGIPLIYISLNIDYFEENVDAEN